MAYDKILLPTNGQAATEGAMLRALNLARGLGARVHALYVADTGPSSGALTDAARDSLHDALDSRGQEATLEAQNRADEIGVELSREIREGNPTDEILACADEQNADLVVMAARSRSSYQHLGGTTRRVLSRVELPVVTVPFGETVTLPGDWTTMYDRIVVATDGSDAAERAAELALGVAERYGADLRIVYVVDTDTYNLQDAPRSIVGILKEGGENAVETIAEKARDRNVPVTSSILRGIPEDAVLQYVAGSGGDLVALGVAGRKGEDRRYLGSTTARVLRRSTVPILTSP
jgi:nucleotide-binding universal stress UspA family protein